MTTSIEPPEYYYSPVAWMSAKEVSALSAQIEERSLDLYSKRPYTLRQVCGEEFWIQLHPVDAQRIGRCMPYLIREGLIDLIDMHEKNGANARLYFIR